LFFGRFVATGLWANVLLIPLGEMAVLPLGLFGLFIDLVFPSLGQLFLASSHVVAGLFLFFAAQAAKVGWEWTVPAPSLWMVLLFEIGLALWCFRRQLGAGLCSAVLFLYLFNWQRPHDTLKVTILSVGQGDSIVLMRASPSSHRFCVREVFPKSTGWFSRTHILITAVACNRSCENLPSQSFGSFRCPRVIPLKKPNFKTSIEPRSLICRCCNDGPRPETPRSVLRDHCEWEAWSFNCSIPSHDRPPTNRCNRVAL
jgi:hypothetical protein